MAYEFKKLSDVNVIESISDSTNVLVEENGSIVKMAANSMIPEDVALKSDVVLAPATASVGQTIVVKAVDENGKPTEWEAAGGGEKYVIDVVQNPEDDSPNPMWRTPITFDALADMIRNQEKPDITVVDSLNGNIMGLLDVVFVRFATEEFNEIQMATAGFGIQFSSDGTLALML